LAAAAELELQQVSSSQAAAALELTKTYKPITELQF
jgi:hypothetical protein